MIISGPESNMLLLSLGGVSPSNMPTRIPRLSANSLIFGSWSLESALVGYKNIADIWFLVLVVWLVRKYEVCECERSDIFCTIGIQNASVLPDAVGATITVSIPSRILLIDSSWNS